MTDERLGALHLRGNKTAAVTAASPVPTVELDLLNAAVDAGTALAMGSPLEAAHADRNRRDDGCQRRDKEEDVSHNVTQRGFEPARDLAGLPSSLTFHDLRHAAASRLIASGIDDELVANLLGHEDSTITRRVYSHVYNRAEKIAEVRQALAG